MRSEEGSKSTVSICWNTREYLLQRFDRDDVCLIITVIDVYFSLAENCRSMYTFE